MVTLVVYVDNMLLAIAELNGAPQHAIRSGIKSLLEERGLTFDERSDDHLVLASGHRITWVESGPSTPDFVQQALDFDSQVKKLAATSRVHEC
ncbi:MAG: hypothetical protein HQL77_15800 [Magnetococcales bacterium]|nr:hypothetical protein [Magnetococcales bacterium]MBF0436818.1 hypothetical protein [Magnetococcales bacterium]